MQSDEAAYWEQEERVRNDPDADYERFLETRPMEPEEEADFRAHCDAWPNGYAVCPKGRCHLGIYHEGECEELPDEEFDEDREPDDDRFLGDLLDDDPTDLLDLF